jgi:hypothetical protein
MQRWLNFLPLAGLLCVANVQASPLLDGAIQPWLAERDAWAFTQHVREFDKGDVKEERVERYDPSLPERSRWKLLELNGHAPTLSEAAAFTQKKGRKRKEPRPLTDYIDFDHVTVQAATPQWVRYEVPLREVNRLVPVDKINLAITVNRSSRAIEQVTAVLREPLKIAFGVARVTDMTFDLHFNSAAQHPPVEPSSVQPNGTAQATMIKFGNRAEFEWSDFTRVTPHPTTRGPSVADAR